MVIRKDPMSKEGISHWSPKLRLKVAKWVFRNLGVNYCPYSSFEDRRLFAQWIKETFGYGYFYIFIWRKGYYKKRSVKRLRPYRIATIEILENKPINFIELTRISKFKWFEPNLKKKSITTNDIGE